jgi:nitrile hydratase
VNGAHDVGGMHGHGPVTVEHDEPVFHCAWERRMFALSIACGAHGRWNIDIVRSAREQMLPGDYLTTTYYEHWLFGLERVAVERGLVTAEELATGLASSAADSKRTLRAENVEPAMRKGRSSQIDVDVLPRFAKGDAVVARNIHPSGYTRLPRYARARRGVVDRDHGVYIFGDSHGTTGDQKPQHCYSVRFAARDLWGAEAPDRDSVFVDLWDDHLDPA